VEGREGSHARDWMASHKISRIATKYLVIRKSSSGPSTATSHSSSSCPSSLAVPARLLRRRRRRRVETARCRKQCRQIRLPLLRVRVTRTLSSSLAVRLCVGAAYNVNHLIIYAHVSNVTPPCYAIRDRCSCGRLFGFRPKYWSRQSSRKRRCSTPQATPRRSRSQSRARSRWQCQRTRRQPQRRRAGPRASLEVVR